MGATTQQVFVVLGEQGEYSDRRVWLRKAFTTEADAQAYADDLSARVREARQEADRNDDWWGTAYEQRMASIDPNVSGNPSYDVTYFIEAVELASDFRRDDV